MQPSPEVKVDPRRYFESVEEGRSKHAARQPVCVYLETTNRFADGAARNAQAEREVALRG